MARFSRRALLKGLGVDTLILTGVATDVCVRATAQDAHQLNYRVLVIPECVAGTTEARNEAALDNIAYVFGRILPAADAHDLLRRARSRRRPKSDVTLPDEVAGRTGDRRRQLEPARQ